MLISHTNMNIYTPSHLCSCIYACTYKLIDMHLSCCSGRGGMFAVSAVLSRPGTPAAVSLRYRRCRSSEARVAACIHTETHTYMSMYVRVYECMCVCMHVFVCVCMYQIPQVLRQREARVPACMYVHTRIHACVYVRTYELMYVCMYLCVCMYASTHVMMYRGMS